MAGDRDAFQQAQHDRLLEGLAASIREKGLAQTQLTDIVRHAKASRRTFYNHFPDKDSCFVELNEKTSRETLEKVAQAIDPDAPLSAQVDAGIDAYLAVLAADPALTVTFYSPGLGDQVVRAQTEGVERFAQLIVAIVEADRKRDRNLPPVSVTRAFMLVAGLAHTIGRALEHGDDLVETGEEIKSVMKAVLAPSPAASSKRKPRARRPRAASR
jgi:AcrR family transcriptional regulator